MDHPNSCHLTSTRLTSHNSSGQQSTDGVLCRFFPTPSQATDATATSGEVAVRKTWCYYQLRSSVWGQKKLLSFLFCRCLRIQVPLDASFPNEITMERDPPKCDCSFATLLSTTSKGTYSWERVRVCVCVCEREKGRGFFLLISQSTTGACRLLILGSSLQDYCSYFPVVLCCHPTYTTCAVAACRHGVWPWLSSSKEWFLTIHHGGSGVHLSIFYFANIETTLWNGPFYCRY